MCISSVCQRLYMHFGEAHREKCIWSKPLDEVGKIAKKHDTVGWREWRGPESYHLEKELGGGPVGVALEKARVRLVTPAWARHGRAVQRVAAAVLQGIARWCGLA
jgi:hypothetical protein